MTVHETFGRAIAVHVKIDHLFLEIEDSLIDYADEFDRPLEPVTGGLIQPPMDLDLNDEITF